MGEVSGTDYEEKRTRLNNEMKHDLETKLIEAKDETKRTLDKLNNEKGINYNTHSSSPPLSSPSLSCHPFSPPCLLYFLLSLSLSETRVKLEKELLQVKEEHTVLQSTHNQLLKRISCHGDKVCTQNLMCIYIYNIHTCTLMNYLLGSKY